MGDRNKIIILWVAGFAGIVLLYSAYKGKSPLTTVNSSLAANNGTVSDSGAGAGGTAGNAGGIALGGTALSTPNTALHAASDGYVYDSNGNMVGQVPPAYAGNPTSYIPHTP